MNTFKILFIFLSLSTSTILGAELTIKDFKIAENFKDRYFMNKKDAQVNLIEIRAIGVKPKLVKVFKKAEAPNLLFVKYSAGDSGTSLIVREYRVAIFNVTKNYFVGDVPLENHVLGKKNPLKGYVQPVWKFTKNQLIVSEGKKIIKKIDL